ncbi:hypothetical protein TSOC_006576 [Tetrabaena socialis]|uniref:Deoxynucleoside kinase domain-containing protein n=1 Tax=Tetrabaena socialis TaxID=47790 RepID=A0A2J8A3B8_9CHLO|nr:hypothetical protein TSOC_006576 [Tetrabaena socialis]|eukprot:PNH07011.1 hypothetical protein TSOC_006576 [Tetrabaena socialis]
MPDGGDDGILQLYYKSKLEYALAFQASVIISRITQLLVLMREYPGSIIIAERSPSSGDIFARQLMTEGIMTPVQCALHNQWIRMSEEVIKTAGIIYLRVSPEKCMERIGKRGRNGESLIEASLIQDLHAFHDDYIDNMEAKGYRVLRLDGDADANSTLPINLTRVQQFISKRPSIEVAEL